MREIPAIKQSVRIKPDQRTFLPNKEKLLHFLDHPIKSQHRLAEEEKYKEKKKDKTPARKTEIKKYYRFQ